MNKEIYQKTRELWQKRYEKAVERFKKAGIKTTKAGAEEYVQLRTQWDRYIYELAPKFAYEMVEIDTAIAKVKASLHSYRR